ncbi:MAG: hypothetical protein CL927_16145 [Deltaproteobacteria bacterium]|nr:hypothetical protein [Deltaproteobacteria bacterium]
MHPFEVSEGCCLRDWWLRLATRRAATDTLFRVLSVDPERVPNRAPTHRSTPFPVSRPFCELRPMECKTVRSLLVPYLEGELAPAQMEWIAAHQQSCPACSAVEAKLRAQGDLLAALPPPPMPERLSSGLWQSMDAHFTEELARLETETHSASTPAIEASSSAHIRLTRRSLTLYATILGLALAFGLWRHDAASTAEARVQALRIKLERAERLRASPSAMPSAIGNYKAAAYAPGRGHL